MKNIEQAFLQGKVSRRKFIKTLAYGLTGFAVGGPALALGQARPLIEIKRPQNTQNKYFDIPPEQLQDVQTILNGSRTYLPKTLDGDLNMNPFWQPNQTTIYLGSLDVDENGVEGEANDIALMNSGIQNDMADADGDGTPSTTSDIIIAQNFADGNISYAPGHWNNLQTIAERESWLENVLDIDLTDQIPYVDGQWVSGDYRNQLEINCAGRIDTSDPHIPDKYDLSMWAKFNIPMYGVAVVNPSTNWGHGMNAILKGDDPLLFDNWDFVESQTDGTNIQPGSQSIPYDTIVTINAIRGFQENGNTLSTPIVYFQVDNTGNTSLYEIPNVSPNPNLITERPTVGINDSNIIMPSNYNLGPNSPNPFNSRTSFEYSLPKSEKIELSVYNLQGRKIETLVEGIQDRGNHKINFDAKNYSSGVYIYNLKTESGVMKSGKMTLMK